MDTKPGSSSTAGHNPTVDGAIRANRDPVISSGVPREAPDHDGDADAHNSTAFFDRDDSKVRNYGHAPSLAERQAIVALIERYYVAAAADNGAIACAVVTKTLTGAIMREYNPKQPVGGDCATIVGGLLKRAFQWSSVDAAALRVIDVRVGSDTGLALMDIHSDDRKILLEREHGAWKLAALFDSEVT